METDLIGQTGKALFRASEKMIKQAFLLALISQDLFPCRFFQRLFPNLVRLIIADVAVSLHSIRHPFVNRFEGFTKHNRQSTFKPCAPWDARKRSRCLWFYLCGKKR